MRSGEPCHGRHVRKFERAQQKAGGVQFLWSSFHLISRTGFSLSSFEFCQLHKGQKKDRLTILPSLIKPNLHVRSLIESHGVDEAHLAFVERDDQ
jgi:hypothetical protein